MSTLSQFLGGGGIKSIQRGFTEFAGTVGIDNLSNRTFKSIPINPVDISKSVVTSTVAGDVIYDFNRGVSINSNASIRLQQGPVYVGGTIQTTSSGILSRNQTLSGLEPGDLVLFFNSKNDGSVSVNSSGWTKIPFNPSDSNPDNDSGPSSAGYYRFANSTGSVTVSPIGGNSNSCMIAFRGIDISNPFDVSPIPLGNRQTNRLPDPPEITTVTDNCIIVAVGFLDNARILKENTIPPSTYNLAEVVSNRDSSTIMTAYKKKSIAGPEDPSEFVGGNDVNKGFTIALRPILNTITSALEITVGGALPGLLDSGDFGAINQTGIIDWQVIEYED